MNQTVITLFLLFFVSVNLCGQKSNNQFDLVFAKYMVDSLINSKYDSIERIYRDSASYFLTKYKIENDTIEHSLYLRHIHTVLEEFKVQTRRHLVYNTTNPKYDSVELSGFIKNHNSEIQSYFNHQIKISVRNNSRAFRSMLPKYFESVSARREPLRLNMIVNEDTIKNFPEELIDIYAVINDKNVDIFNNEKNRINLDPKYSYDSIQYIVVTYNNRDFEFFKDLTFDPPPELKESFERGRKEQFNEDKFTNLLFWHVIVQDKEKPETITVKLRSSVTININNHNIK